MTEPKTELRVCRCGMEFVAEIKRGRPQTWCDPCRDGINASARQRMRVEEEESKPPDERRMTAVERVEYLELLLKSRNTHISQHRKDEF